MKILRLVVILAISAISTFGSLAQTASVKTNLLGWATTTPNLGFEFGIGRQATIQLFGALNPWEFGDTRIRFWNVEPEFRYFFCEKFNGHFIGIHALGGQYNLRNVKVPLTNLPDLTGANKGRHVEGWYVGGGITYGYQWLLSRHWNFEASLGVGYAYSPFKYYGRCNRLFDKDGHPMEGTDKDSGICHYFGPTKLALSIMYVF